ncbi:MAG: glycerophosphodiester phosphodiesterase family protein [bacterium]
MNRKVIYSLLIFFYLIVILLFLSLEYFSDKVININVNNKKLNYEWTEHTLVAHALGGVNNVMYTNNLEAFHKSYKNGFRVFEVDLIFTADKVLVAKHDWINEATNKKKPLKFKEFKEKKRKEGYTALTFKQVAELMNNYPDIYIITDTKTKHLKTVEKQFQHIVNISKEINPQILDRIIPQTYNERMYTKIKEIYPFESIIYTLYATQISNNRVIDFCLANNIQVISMFPSRLSRDFLEKIKENNIKIYLHTLNDIKELKKYKEKNIEGFYTDFILPHEV